MRLLSNTRTLRSNTACLRSVRSSAPGVLGEFGDDRTRWPDPASRRAYAGSAPITRQSGKKRVVLARNIRNKRLYDATRWWAFAALSASPGARAYYDQRRAVGDGHEAAL